MPGAGAAPGFLPSSSAGRGLGGRIGVCSPPCFLLLSAYPTPPHSPEKPPSPVSLTRCLFSSKESACPPSGSQAPSLPPGLCAAAKSPHLPLPLTPSYRDWKERVRHLLGLMDAPCCRGRGWGSSKAKPDLPAFWGLGTLSHQEVKSFCQAESLRPAGWAASTRPSSPLLLPL